MPMPAASFDRYARVAVLFVLAVGCFLVLRPFIGAILFSAVVCSCTWPLYEWLRRRLGGRAVLASLILVLLLVLLAIVPLALAAIALTEYTPKALDYVRQLLADGVPALPSWLTGLPFIGEHLDARWRSLTESREALLALRTRLAEPMRDFLIALGAILGEGLLQLVLAAFVGFFFYRDGEALVRSLRTGLDKLAGAMAERLFDIVNNTVSGVIYGILGTALAQALVALLGFVVAGVPGAMLLATATFFLAMVPIGPPLVWGGAAVWLAQNDMYGWAAFMVLYGLLVISSIDNFIKPYLISRGSAQPLAIVFIGVLGGALAFGFIGVFLGPVLLAVAFTLLRQWTRLAAVAPPDQTPS